MKKLFATGGGILFATAIVMAMVLLVGCGGNSEDKDTSGDESVSTLALEISTPQDESVVTSATIVVSGTTEANAVVSVNGVLVNVDDEGQFSTTITLEEGPNYIEVLASDYEGNETGKSLSVIYVP